jgi:hypothetical protein
MRKRVATAVLAAAACGYIGVPPHPLLAQTAAGQPAAAGGPAGQADRAGQHAAIPVRQVVLYSSGVGYFEHFGTVNGSGTTELRFKAAQVNDILKSLVLQDLDKGRVGVITYPSQDPVAKTLRSFQIDITGNPSLPELLNQLRGAKVTVSAGGDKAGGTVLGVERKPRPVGTGDGVKVIDVPFLNLIADDGGIRSVSLEDVRTLELQDKKLQDELNRALAALAGARDQDKKPVNIGLQGEGERRVRIGYVVETPVWKTSYRLILTGGGGPAGGEKKDADKPQGEKAAASNPDAGGSSTEAVHRAFLERLANDQEQVVRSLTAQLGGENHPAVVSRKKDLAATREELAALDAKADAVKPGGPAGAAAAGKAAGTGSLQGWAIVENQTDNDWNNVQLSLVSGRPISFIQDLYQPLYVPRPVVQPELYASLRPQTYDAAMSAKVPMTAFNQPPPAPVASPAPAAAAAPAGGMAGGRAARVPAAKLERPSEVTLGAGASRLGREELGEMDAAASVNSIASAAKVGELFQYTVGSVTLPRQTSAMIPVVTDPVVVERLSIYNASVLPKNPLLGARVKNTTGKHLLQGPVTVLDGGAYAGDARIDDLPPGQERLVSYGVDQQVLVQAVNAKQENAVQTGKIVKGVLQLTRRLVASQEYAAENKGEKDKTLVIEHPRRGGGWKLAEPAKADETTDALYRFKGGVQAGKGTKLAVREELVTVERVVLLNVDDGMLDVYVRTGEIPQTVRDALTKAAQLRQGLAGTRQQVQQRRQRLDVITKEQTRLRDNMKTVAQNTDYYQRLLKKLDEQESTIEGLQKEVAGLEAEAEQQRKAMEDYLNGLTVG